MTRSNIGLPYYRCETQGAYLTDENPQLLSTQKSHGSLAMTLGCEAFTSSHMIGIGPFLVAT
jgi:hypothetical protein